ncbi:hypothetical protein DEO72_LG2g5677 [Vigna unguiculata]|uniref:Uncharacterized protein n=1 Tax=Vigna unguiculata TaxID=3917 RepID=A0A4D6L9U5_VIGUN|nr:hypothetical protein DEO72_LG2g5677 [Vigna unguiculata]
MKVVVECEDGVANEDVCVGDGEEELADKENGVGNEEVCVGDGEEALADKGTTNCPDIDEKETGLGQNIGEEEDNEK